MSITFINQLYQSLLGREADEPGAAYWSGQMQSGEIGAIGITQAFLESAEFKTFVQPLVRLYFSAFNRAPDEAGLAYWVGALREGATITEIAEQFAQSTEYQTAYEAFSDRRYLETLYMQALGREPDTAGLAHWLQLLESGVPRFAVLANFAQSSEMIAVRSQATDYALLQLALTGESMPMNALIDVLPIQAWPTVIEAIYTGPQYRGVDVPGLDRYQEPEPEPRPQPEPEPEPEPEPDPEPDPDTTAPTILSFTAAPPATVSLISSESGMARLTDGTTVLVSQPLAAANIEYALQVSEQLALTTASLEVSDSSGNVTVSPTVVLLGTTTRDVFNPSGAGQHFLFGFDGDDRFEYDLMSDFLQAGEVRDVIVGGAGENSIRLLDSGAITIAATDLFDNVSDVESLAVMAANTNPISMALHSNAFTAGLRTISLMPDTDPLGTNLIDGSNATSNQSLVLYGSAGSDSLVGGAGADILQSGDGADTLDGGSGNDVLEGGDGADNLAGGDGNDMFVFGRFGSTDVQAGELINGGIGNDTVRVGSSMSFQDLATARLLTDGSIEHVLLESFVQATFLGSQVSGQAISINTQFNQGNEVLGIKLVGTPSTDLSALTFSAVNGGFDYTSAVTVVGDADNNTVIAPTQVSNIETLDGDDVITPGAGAHSIDGGDGNDVFRYTDNIQLASNATLIGGVGIDTIEFTQPIDVFTTGSAQAGSNFHADFSKVTQVERVALTGANNINLGDVFPTAGINTIITGDDRTTLQYDTTVIGTMAVDAIALADNKTLALTQFGADGGHWFTVTNLKGDVDATDLNGAISVTAAAGAGFDVSVIAGVRDDTVIGGEGNDSVQGGLGNDSMRGGAGNDSLSGGAGNDTILGNTGDDIIHGDEGNDAINAGQGNDTVYGGADNDIIEGGSTGDDLLYGEQGDDTINGSDGNDLVTGGAGADSLTGGAGTDTFVYNAVFGASSDSSLNAGFDRIVDLELGDVIQMNLSNVNSFDAASSSFVVTTQLDGQNLLILNSSGLGSSGLDDASNVVLGIGAYDGTTAASQVTYNLIGTAGNDSITAGAGNDTIAGGIGADTIAVGAGSNTIIYSASGQTQGSGFISGSSVANADIFIGLDAGDVLQLYEAASVQDATVLVGLAGVNNANAGGVALRSGSYDAAARTFTIATASDAVDDLMIQWGDGTAIQSIVLSGDYYNGATTIQLVGNAAGDFFTLAAV